MMIKTGPSKCSARLLEVPFTSSHSSSLRFANICLKEGNKVVVVVVLKYLAQIAFSRSPFFDLLKRERCSILIKAATPVSDIKIINPRTYNGDGCHTPSPHKVYSNF